jgi:uncharacterized cupredoxin-like copper-binding protein
VPATAGVELHAENALAVARPVPQFAAFLDVHLLVVDVEVGLAEPGAPRVCRLPEEPVGAGRADRDGQEDLAAACRDAPQRPERLEWRLRIVLRAEVIPGVVAADVLERGDAEDGVERPGVEGEPPHVRLHRRHPGDLALREVDAYEFACAEPEERGEPDGLGEGIADVQHARLPSVPPEGPGELDRALVELGGRDELVRALAGGARRGAPADAVVEQAQPPELIAVRQFGEEAGAREAVLSQRGEGMRACFVVRRPPQEQAESAVDEVLVRERGQLEVRGQPLVHRSDSTLWCTSAVLVQTLSTGHKIGLGVVAAVFIAFALASAFLFPRFRASFPGRGLPAFIVVCFVFFFGMLTAVEVFGAEKKEKGGEHAAESTTEPTTTEQQPETNTVTLPAPTTTAPKPKPEPKAQTVPVTETEFKIALPSTSVKAGPTTFDVKNAGKTEHDLVVTGNGLTEGTPRFPGGQSKTLKVTLKPGTYKLFCSVPGHEQAGMVTRITVGS